MRSWLAGRTVAEVDVLWALYDQAIIARVNEMEQRKELGMTRAQLAWVLAQFVITSHLGAAWFDEHVRHSATSRLSRGYLSGAADAQQTRLLYRHREIELARRLYQLQSFVWFDELVAKVRTDTLSGTAFELDVVWSLQAIFPHVEGREQHGRNGRGNNFDVVAVLPGIGPVPVEAKAKDDDTPFTAATVRNTLRTAARQLPEGELGIVFLRLPPAWVGPRLEEQYVDAVAEGIRQTSRVAAVITALDKPSVDVSAGMGSVRRFHHLALHEDCPEPYRELAMMFVHSWDQQLSLFAAHAPF